MKNKPMTKFLHVRIPIYMYETLQELAPYISTTMNGTIITILDHGINYEMKKRRKEMKKTATPESATVNQDQQYNSKELERTLEIAKVKWVD